ncbi:hypothetical protein AQ477_19245 [Burkholderia thailandensis]|nr:hypothetical protein AQ477_19245 [Burkholderia thailandensis]KXF57880.1 hypothetical protein AQ476_24345 [Burkholderia thailandensis]PNE77373.1 hypothetical protein A8H37_03140 [Burkholderia thailandensis]
MALLVLAIGAKYDTFILAFACVSIKSCLQPRAGSTPDPLPAPTLTTQPRASPRTASAVRPNSKLARAARPSIAPHLEALAGHHTVQSAWW